MTEEQRLQEETVKQSYDNMMSDSVVDIDEDEADYNKWYEEWKKNISTEKLDRMMKSIHIALEDFPEGY